MKFTIIAFIMMLSSTAFAQSTFFEKNEGLWKLPENEEYSARYIEIVSGIQYIAILTTKDLETSPLPLWTFRNLGDTETFYRGVIMDKTDIAVITFKIVKSNVMEMSMYFGEESETFRLTKIPISGN